MSVLFVFFIIISSVGVIDIICGFLIIIEDYGSITCSSCNSPNGYWGWGSVLGTLEIVWGFAGYVSPASQGIGLVLYSLTKIIQGERGSGQHKTSSDCINFRGQPFLPLLQPRLAIPMCWLDGVQPTLSVHLQRRGVSSWTRCKLII